MRSLIIILTMAVACLASSYQEPKQFSTAWVDPSDISLAQVGISFSYRGLVWGDSPARATALLGSPLRQYTSAVPGKIDSIDFCGTGNSSPVSYSLYRIDSNMYVTLVFIGDGRLVQVLESVIKTPGIEYIDIAESTDVLTTAISYSSSDMEKISYVNTGLCLEYADSVETLIRAME
jgi:hypothetical protein